MPWERADRCCRCCFVVALTFNNHHALPAQDWDEVLAGAFDEEAGKGVVLTLTDRETTPTLLKTMAIQYRDAFAFVEVPPSEKVFLDKFGVQAEDLAQLFVLPASKVRTCI